MPEPLRVSPSTLARYFFLDCERMLRYAATPASRRPSERVPPRPTRPSVLQQSVLDGGYDWEEDILRRLGKRAVVGEPGRKGAPPRERVLPYSRTLEALRQAPDATYLYQAQIEPPLSF